MSRRILIILVASVLLVGGIALYATTRTVANDTGSSSSTEKGPVQPKQNNDRPTGETVTVEGTLICLMPKDTSGPQDLLCAIGLREDDGTSYALSSDDSTELGSLPTGERVRVTGVLTEEHGKYDTAGGRIHITSVERL